jgi:hypothetical protein
MSVELVLPALSAFQMTVTGVAIAFPVDAVTPLPDSLVDLPAFVNFPGAASDNWSVDGSDRYMERRRYRMLLYLLGYGEGIEREGEMAARPFYTRIAILFAGIPSLGNIPGVQRTFLAGDSGLTTLRYANTSYWGIEFWLDVEYHHRRLYATGE